MGYPRGRSRYPVTGPWKGNHRAGKHQGSDRDRPRTLTIPRWESVLTEQGGHRGRRAILVLGMHRSGTSALTGVLSALGVAAPRTPIQGDEWNSKGYWESARLNHFHERLLTASGSAWNDWGPFDGAWAEGPEAVPYVRDLAALLHAEYGEAPLFAVKDPRICRFLPFWLRGLSGLEIEPGIILPLRDPMEVAESLYKRDGMPMVEGLLLWLRHTLDAEFTSRGLPRSFVYYDDLLEDWRGVAGRIGSDLDITWPIRAEGAEEAVQNFISSDMKHSTASHDMAEVPAVVGEWVQKCRTAFRALAAAPDSSERYLAVLDDVRTDFDRYCSVFATTIRSTRRRLDSLNAEFNERRGGRRIESYLSGLFGEKMRYHRRVWTAKLLLVFEPLLTKEYAQRIRRRLDRIEVQSHAKRKETA